jgi:ribosome-associated toxin RatA of RatAB toxin-antitoxin module
VSEIAIARSALVARSAAEMFELVCAVEDYPRYLEGCIGAEVYSRTDTEMRARLDLGRAGLRYSFTTRNLLYRPERIELVLEEGPFRSFQGVWTFTQLGEQGSKVALELRFQLNHRLLGKPARALFARVGDDLVRALVARAAQRQ